MQPEPIVLFDGVCNLCNAFVRWLLPRDRDQRLRFASLQSEAGQAAIRAAGAQPEDLPDSAVLIDAEGLHTRSTAALRIIQGLGFPWSLARVLLWVPRWLRDPVYGWIARNRYRWFGKREACPLPKPEDHFRFLDADEPRE